ncbi:hypothetical protein CCR95_03120 [Thiocystis minor]|nr:LamG domain-containing protein [Thiocystis minor]MBK5963107.1 hypothetical protein [Thiocystis minor]
MIRSTDPRNTFSLTSLRYRRTDFRGGRSAGIAAQANSVWRHVCSALFLCLAAFAACPGPAVAIDLNAGRVVHYSFDSYRFNRIVLDLSGQRNHGTLVYFDVPPVLEVGHNGTGLALIFDRARQQRIDVGTGAQPSLDLTRFTIAAWIRITESDTEERNWEIAEKDYAYWLNVRNGHDSPRTAYRLRCGAIINGVQRSVDSDLQVPHDGTWVHVAGTFNGSFLRVYINGARRGSLAVAGQVTKNDYPLAVGANNKPFEFPEDPFHNWMTGAMDDFRLYRRALTGAEIKALAKQ